MFENANSANLYCLRVFEYCVGFATPLDSLKTSPSWEIILLPHIISHQDPLSFSPHAQSILISPRTHAGAAQWQFIFQPFQKYKWEISVSLPLANLRSVLMRTRWTNPLCHNVIPPPTMQFTASAASQWVWLELCPGEDTFALGR